MENSRRYSRDDAQSFLTSPSSSSSITTPTRPVISRSESITFIKTDVSSFKQIVQMLTTCSENPNQTQKPEPKRYSIPPIKPVPTKKQSSASSSSSSSAAFCLYERRNSKRHLNIHAVRSRVPDKLSPSLLDFPSLLLSPDTPLFPDTFSRSGSVSQSSSYSGFGHYDPKLSSDVEEREIREKGFYLLPSPSPTRSGQKPRLLPLFPLTSPGASDSFAAST